MRRASESPEGKRARRTLHDVIVVGGGPAGLSAALVLGRCRRRVLVLDDARYRNAASHAVHGLLGHDGVPPAELLAVGRREVERYGGEIRQATVTAARRGEARFEVTTSAHVPTTPQVPTAAGAKTVGEATTRGTAGTAGTASARMLLLATGIADEVPRVPGFAELYGKSIFHCPLCDGWERREQPLAALAHGAGGVELALALTAWSRDVVLFSDGHRVGRPERQHLARYGIAVYMGRVAAFESREGALEAVVLADGTPVPRRALFFHLGARQRSELATHLGCRVRQSGRIWTDRLGLTSVAGVYVTGDASGDVQLIAVAVAEGAKAAYAINKALRESDAP